MFISDDYYKCLFIASGMNMLTVLTPIDGCLIVRV
jgi:hypothetical protein